MELSRYLTSRLRECEDGEDNDKSIDNIGGGHRVTRQANAEREKEIIRTINSHGNSRTKDGRQELLDIY